MRQLHGEYSLGIENILHLIEIEMKGSVIWIYVVK
jgi:hypothetical protein